MLLCRVRVVARKVAAPSEACGAHGASSTLGSVSGSWVTQLAALTRVSPHTSHRRVSGIGLHVRSSSGARRSVCSHLAHKARVHVR